MADDSSVEIRVTGSLDSSVAVTATQAKAAISDVAASTRASLKETADIQRSNARENLEALEKSLETAKALREQDARITEAQLRSQAKGSPFGEIDADERIAAIHQQLLQQDMAGQQLLYARKDEQRQQDIAKALAASGQESAAYVDAVNAKKLADLEFANQHALLEDRMVLQSTQDAQKLQQTWNSYIDGTVQAFGTGVKGMINGTETFRKAEMGVLSSLENLFFQQGERIAENWIVNLLSTEGAQKASALNQAASYAGVAGAAGVASYAAAPFPLDLGAPAFGASMAQAAMSFGALAQGVNVVPQDMIAQVHAGERIMPAADNRALMAALAGGGTGGDAHLHYAPTINAPTGQSLRQMLVDQGSDMIAFVQSAMRNGQLRAA